MEVADGGEWGTGPFENDEGIEWLSGLGTASDFEYFASAFAKVKSFPVFTVESRDASRAIAAAEVVAIYVTGSGDDIPIEIVEFMHLHPTCPPRVIAEARRAVERICRNSKLKDQWREIDGWKTVVSRLQSRLNEN